MKSISIISILLLVGLSGFGQEDEYVRPNIKNDDKGSDLIYPQVSDTGQLLEIKIATLDSVKYSKEFAFNSGVYRSFDEFKFNSPSLTLHEGEWSGEGSNMDTNIIYYKDRSQLERKLKKRNVWGYCFKNEVYVFISNKVGHAKAIDENGYTSAVFSSRKLFLKIQDFGMIMTTEAIEKESFNATPNPANNTYPQQRTPYLVEDPIIIDFSNGILYKNTVENFSYILARDKKLHQEFTAIKPLKKQKHMMFMYRKKFNESNPIYFYKLQ